MPHEPGRVHLQESGSPFEDLGEPRWTFDCTGCDIDTYGGEDIRQLVLEHVRETGHTVSVTRRQVGHLRPEEAKR